jgi:hypothetical protein
MDKLFGGVDAVEAGEQETDAKKVESTAMSHMNQGSEGEMEKGSPAVEHVEVSEKTEK